MIALTERAYAKLNFSLDVLTRRADGYHDLCSVMQTISLYDTVELFLETGKPWQLSCNDKTLAADETNLAWRAAEVFCRETGAVLNGLELRLTKRIPSQAGLGGGSADAAAVLRALNRHCKTGLSAERLCALGALVGSDVPFCVMGGTALAKGRGERLTKLPPAPRMRVVVCKGALAFSTPVLFARLDATEIPRRPDTQALCAALCGGDVRAVGAALCNVFEFAVAQAYPQIAQMKAALLACGACGAQMTGSGSAVFGLFDDDARAEEACKMLRDSKLRIFLAETV